MLPRSHLPVAVGLALLCLHSCDSDPGLYDFDGDGSIDEVDCAPQNPDIHPLADEECADGVDNDCDTLVDGADPDCGGDDDSASGADDDDDDTSPSDDDTGDDDTTEVDADSDGYTVSQGDCDDADPAINPGAVDVCDALDNDCDGIHNENSDGWDSYEDAVDVPDLGSVPMGNTEVTSYIQGLGDSDSFTFTVTDTEHHVEQFHLGFSIWPVPDVVDVVLELYWIEDGDGQYGGLQHVQDSNELGGIEFFDHYGSLAVDDSGVYQITVSTAQGYDCEEAYELSVYYGDSS